MTLEGDPDAAVEFLVDGAALARYVVRPEGIPQLESPKPYLHPMRTLGGELVSLYRPHDHVWHKGIQWSLPDVGEHNFWGGPTFVRGRDYVQLPNNGAMEHDAVVRAEADADSARYAHTLDWVSQQGDSVIAELRQLEVRLAPDPGAWVLVFDSELTNLTDATLAFGSPTTNGRDNAGYGGLTWRGPRSFDGGRIHTPSGTDTTEDARGTRQEWLGLSGQHDGTAAWSTVVMVDDAGNPRHPNEWFVRNEDYATICASPFFSTELDLEPGGTLRYRYAVVVADGHEEHDDAVRLADAGRAALGA